MNYPSIRIEGAIFSPDILDRLEDVSGQRPTDFGLDGSTKVKDEIARAWADAQDYWRIFQRKLEPLKPDSPATSETRNNWVVPLLGLLGHQLEYQARGVTINDKLYPVSHRTINRGNTPIHIIGCREPAGLDRKPEKTGGPRMSAHAMVQEYLNLKDELYGLVTNGLVLRLLRDSSRLIKLTYLEFDLDRIFSDGLFADFAVLYRLLHASRLPQSVEDSSACWLERYHQDSLDSGARIREGLSKAVEQAILAFANGFLSQQGNHDLHERIQSGQLTPENYYQHLLRLIYRLLFLLVIEERGLVFPADAESTNREMYYRFYSLQRLRCLSEKQHLADPRHRDLWLALLTTFRLFESGGPGPKMGLAPLAGDLFDPEAIGPLATCTLGNDVLLGCLRSLGLYQHPDSSQLIRVNYAALNVEEFGSVYEGLLEYKPVFIFTDGRIEFIFAQGDARAATGSHYTPDDLVQPLIKHSLDYLIAEKLQADNPEQALLSLRVADISCGSGHILLAAARRIATELAYVRTGEEQPSPSAFRSAVRAVIRHCIYGVDLNPLAVELCKVALWLEAHNPGDPLNFLDHHIKCGNAIVGFARREELERGVPDEAFVTRPGDDKETAAILRKRNKAERLEHKSGQTRVEDYSPQIKRQLDDILRGWQELSALPEQTPEEIEAKKRRYLRLTKDQESLLIQQIAAIPIAQFYLEKTPENVQKFVTDAEYRRYLTGERQPQGQATATAWARSFEKRFFHWFLEFPEVIEQGGFDCILGNPPYLGGQGLSGTYGHAFCGFVKWEYAPTGLSDLVVYFVRRIFSLLRSGALSAFITTNSIKDGDNRRDGLDQIVVQGGSINMVVRGIKWPGRANLIVSLVSIFKGEWTGTRVLDGKKVNIINTFFEDYKEAAEPIQLNKNTAHIFQGSIFLGDGFLLSHEEGDRYKENNLSSSEVIFPVINGKEINNQPDQNPQRQIINFFDFSLEKAKSFGDVFDRVEELVKPERLNNKRICHLPWWQYERPRLEVYQKIKILNRCFVTARVTKHLNFSSVPTNYIFLNNLYIFTTDRWDLFAVVQSTLHEIWARKYSMALKQDLQYSPSDCFLTFPFPQGLWQIANPHLAEIGEHYHEHRRSLMLQLWLGLTDIYNLFHRRNLTTEHVAKVSKKSPEEAEAGYQGILELRNLHSQLDNAIRDAYGWPDLDLGHDFHEMETLAENDRVRYTISPEARKEILKRLLALNHQRAAEQVTTKLPKTTTKRTRKSKKDERQGSLF